MKKLLLRLSLFITGIIVGQPTPPVYEQKNLQLSVNYGIEKTLGGDFSLHFNKNILGVGYVGYIGSNTSNLVNNIDQYQQKNEAMYLTYGRHFNRWVLGFKVGKQNNTYWTKHYLGSSTNSSYTYDKNPQTYTTMVGVYGGYCLTDRFRVNVGADSFSTLTLGFTASL